MIALYSATSLAKTAVALFFSMAIFRCNKCGHLQEQPDGCVGETIFCPKCANPAPVYNALFFVGKLLEKYFASQREIARLREISKVDAGLPSPTSTAQTALDEIDLANTDQLASELQHGPIYDWFLQKQIKVQADTRSVDTTGFFDEVAVSIGGNLLVLKEVLDRIRWAQQKEYSSATIHLGKKSEDDARAITTFCQQLYDFSFVAKCFHNRQENNIRLIVQTAPAIRNFFNGEWLEWYALMNCLQYAKARKKRFSCARKLVVSLQNNERYEIDVFMLIDGNLPICVECKTGEFRQDIDRFLTLRKRLGINGKNFIMCVTGLGEEQARGLTTMYDMTFTNELELATQLARVF